MDLMSAFLCCYVTLSLVSLSQQSTAQNECRQCKPGYYASRLCSESYDTICKACTKGTFTSNLNHFSKCSKCSKCELGEFVSVPCSSHSDTLCESCSAVKDVVTESFLRDCFQSDSPYSVSGASEEIIKDKSDKNARTLPEEYHSVYEGSGAPEDKDIVNETLEGSGETYYETDTDKPANTTKVPLLPPDTEEIVHENITTVTQTNVSDSSYSSTTTTKHGVVSIDKGIVLHNKTEVPGTTDIVITQAPTKSSSILTEITTTVPDSTTIKLILVDPDKGIKLPTETTTRKKGLRKGHGHDYDVSVNTEDDNSSEDVKDPSTGASKAQTATAETSGVSVGVFVAVCLICAAVFFALGLMVNKYWANRRARTFNVEEAEKQNGKTFHGGTIEFKDPEKNQTTKTGIYDEIPADKQNGKGAQPVAKESLNKDPVYSKPLKRTANNTVNKANPEPSSGASEKDGTDWGGMIISHNSSSGSLILSPNTEQSANEDKQGRPVSASIKYMDDEQTDDERETDKLLPQGNTEKNSAQTSGESSDQNDTTSATAMNNDVKDDVVVTEVTPMLTKDNDTVNV